MYSSKMYSPRDSRENWRNVHDPTKVDKIEMDKMVRKIERLERELLSGTGEIETLKGTIEDLRREIERSNRKTEAVVKGRKVDQNRLKKLEDLTKSLRRSERIQNNKLAKLVKMIEDETLDKSLIRRSDFTRTKLKRFEREGTYHNATEWIKFVKFSTVKEYLSKSSAFYKNPEQSPRDLRLYIQRLYTTRK